MRAGRSRVLGSATVRLNQYRRSTELKQYTHISLLKGCLTELKGLIYLSKVLLHLIEGPSIPKGAALN